MNVVEIIVRATDKTTAAWKSVTNRAKRMSKKLMSIGHGIGGAFKSVFRFAKRAAMAVAAVGASFIYAARQAEIFNKQVAQIATLSNLSINETKKKVRELAAEFGIAKDVLTKGLYQALSAGIPEGNLFEFIRVAAKAATAGAADLSYAVEATTRIMDAYGEAAGDATHINDMLFKTVKNGVITYDQLSSQIGKVAGIAQKAGITLEDLLATIATSSKTVNAEQLFTGIRAAIMSVTETSQGADLVLKKGLGAALNDVATATGGTLFGLRSVISEARALPVALSLSGANASKFAKNLDEVTNSAGEMDRAFGKMDEQTKLGKSFQALHNILLRLGDIVLPHVAALLSTVAGAMENLLNSSAFASFQSTVEGMLRDAKDLIRIIGFGGKGRDEAIKALGDLLKASIAVGGDMAAKALVRVAPLVGALIAGAIKSPGKAMESFAKRDAKALASMVNEGMISKFQAYFPRSSLTSGQEAERVRRREKIAGDQLREQGLRASMGIGAGSESALTAAKKNLDAVIDTYWWQGTGATTPGKPKGDLTGAMDALKQQLGGMAGDMSVSTKKAGTISQATQNVLSRLQEQGHKTEQWGGDRTQDLLSDIAKATQATAEKIEGVMTASE